MKNRLLSIIYGILIWVLGVSFYLTSFYIQMMENPDLQANIVLVIGILPSTCLGTYLFYKNGVMKPSSLALTFMSIAAMLDALITVPVFIIPAGGSYYDFFSNPMFYFIMVEFYFIVTFFGNHLTKHLKK